MNVESLNLGPIVGHVSDSSVKVWGRAAEKNMQGVARYKKPGTEEIKGGSGKSKSFVFSFVTDPFNTVFAHQ